MNPEDRLSKMLNRARGEDRVTESSWNEFASSARRSVRIQRFAAAGLAVVLLGVAGVGAFAAFGDSGSGGNLPPAGPTETRIDEAPPSVLESDATDIATPPPDKVSRPVEVWLVNPETDILSWGYTIMQIQPEAPVVEVVVNLLEGPTSSDIEAGVETAIPEGTKLLDAFVEGNVATLDLSSHFLSGNQTGDYLDLRTAQLVFQATQVDGIDLVEILVEGHLPGPSIAGRLGRNNFEDVAPAIVVNEPKIGSEHESPIVLTGTANVFEATVSYELTLDEKGQDVIFESFTTAACGSGCRGEFSDEIPFEVDEPTDATLRVFETSAEDGSRLHEIILPLRLLPSD